MRYVLVLLLATPVWASERASGQGSPIATQSVPAETDSAALAAKVDALAVAFAEFREQTNRDREQLVQSVREESQQRTNLAQESFRERTALALRQSDDRAWKLPDVVSLMGLFAILAGAASWLNSAFIAGKTAPIEKQVAEQRLREEAFQSESRASRAALAVDIRDVRTELHEAVNKRSAELSAMRSEFGEMNRQFQDKFSEITSDLSVTSSRLTEAKVEIESQKRGLEGQIAASNNEYFRWIAILWEKAFPGERFPDRVMNPTQIAHNAPPAHRP
jgi:hypothetical protein